MSRIREEFRKINKFTWEESPETIEGSLGPTPLVGVSSANELDPFADSAQEAGELFEMGPSPEDELHQ